MNIVAIVQARMGSKRLPGKIMLDIAGKPMLMHDINRLRRAKTLNKIVIATTSDPQDDQLADYCSQQNWDFFRGSQRDVLDRYYQTAREFEADVVVRITSDCPLIEPVIVDQVVAKFLEPNTPYDYIANFLPERTYPRGLDTEVFSVDVLTQAWEEDKNPATREHVTPYLYQHPELFSIGGFTNIVDYSNHRWTVDTPDDLELIRKIYDHFGHNSFDWLEVLALFQENPDWMLLNQHIEQKKIAS